MATDATADPFRTGADKDPLKKKLVEIEAAIDKLEKSLEEPKNRLRGNPQNTSLRQDVQQQNLQLAQLRNEQGEVARAISIVLGGKQYQPPIG